MMTSQVDLLHLTVLDLVGRQVVLFEQIAQT